MVKWEERIGADDPWCRWSLTQLSAVQGGIHSERNLFWIWETMFCACLFGFLHFFSSLLSLTILSLALPLFPVKAFKRTPLMWGYHKRGHCGSLNNPQRKLDVSSLHLPPTTSPFSRIMCPWGEGKALTSITQHYIEMRERALKWSLFPKYIKGITVCVKLWKWRRQYRSRLLWRPEGKRWRTSDGNWPTVSDWRCL